ncbi:MAG: hypothetical protein NT036_04400 [Candidatus Omnitrophica bacterium]|nr:hypothetical protein [Candidatus Omnitrophota bacterium]
MKKIIFILTCIIFWAGPSFSSEEVEYKKFKFDESSCDVGVHYKSAQKGLLIGVSAIATGKGAEFRKWQVSDIKINIDGRRFRPDKESNFYVTEKSLFRVPGAIVFAAIGAFGEYGGSNLNNNLSKIGVGLGMGLIALTAKGEITGERCLFNIPPDELEKMVEGRDSIDILIENEDLHLRESIKIAIIKPSGELGDKYNFSGMTQDGLSGLMNTLKDRIVVLEKEQADYKYGQDPEFDVIQKKIESCETERGMAYKAWFERKAK